MSPEYAMNDVVSIKTYVFSFGVLLLEIVSGKKNNSRYHSDHPLNLIEYVSFSFDFFTNFFGSKFLLVHIWAPLLTSFFT